MQEKGSSPGVFYCHILFMINVNKSLLCILSIIAWSFLFFFYWFDLLLIGYDSLKIIEKGNRNEKFLD